MVKHAHIKKVLVWLGNEGNVANDRVDAVIKAFSKRDKGITIVEMNQQGEKRAEKRKTGIHGEKKRDQTPEKAFSHNLSAFSDKLTNNN